MICDAGIRELGRKGEEIGEMVEIDESNIGNYLSRDCNYTVLGENGLSDLQAIKDGISNPMEMNGFQALKPTRALIRWTRTMHIYERLRSFIKETVEEEKLIEVLVTTSKIVLPNTDLTRAESLEEIHVNIKLEVTTDFMEKDNPTKLMILPNHGVEETWLAEQLRRMLKNHVEGSFGTTQAKAMIR
ncbi:hypothetical protein V6N13_004366 [Hibiscus sabdariffa]